MDLGTGLVVASSSMTIREMVLGILRADPHPIISWYQCQPTRNARARWPLQFGQVGGGTTWPSNSINPNYPRVYPWTTYSAWTIDNTGPSQSWTFGEEQTLSQFLTAMLGRRQFLQSKGYVIWFPGAGGMRWWAYQNWSWDVYWRVELPALAIYGFWAIHEGSYNTPYIPNIERLGGWLCNVGNGVDDPKTMAAVVDEHHFAVTMRTAPKG